MDRFRGQSAGCFQLVLRAIGSIQAVANSENERIPLLAEREANRTQTEMFEAVKRSNT